MYGKTLIDNIERDLVEADSEGTPEHIEQMLDDGVIEPREAAFLQGYHENM